MAANLVNIPSGWVKKAIGECVFEKRKSQINVEDASDFGSYPFFTSGDSVLRFEQKLVDGENLYLADGALRI